MRQYWNRPRFAGRSSAANTHYYETIPLRGARIAHLSCLAFLLFGFSQVIKAQPTATSSDYSVAVFANAPNGFTNPDSISSFRGTIFVGYSNNTRPPVAVVTVDIVQFSPSGQVLKTYAVVGKNDGLKYQPVRWQDLRPAERGWQSLLGLDRSCGRNHEKIYLLGSATAWGRLRRYCLPEWADFHQRLQSDPTAADQNTERTKHLTPRSLRATLVGNQSMWSRF